MRARTSWCCRLRMIYYARRRDDDSGANQKRWTAGRRAARVETRLKVFRGRRADSCSNIMRYASVETFRFCSRTESVVMLCYCIMCTTRAGRLRQYLITARESECANCTGWPAWLSPFSHVNIEWKPLGSLGSPCIHRLPAYPRIMRERVYVEPYIMRPIARDFPGV